MVIALFNVVQFALHRRGEFGVEKAIKWLLDESEPISPDSINALLSSRATLPDPKQVHIQAVHLQ
ncbi:MAG: hypothetical protein QGH20_07605, partial [Candidatus Latescibacteria bacterium]|nr:hypothetical protein [Candidatus Latescibacterota bacterium]